MYLDARGHILLTTLVVTALLSGIIAAASAKTLSALRARHQEITADKNTAASLKGVFNKLEDNVASPSDHFKCDTKTLEFGFYPKTLCAAYDTPSSPLIDFNLLLKDSAPCTKVSFNSNHVSASTSALTPGSARSIFSCRTIPSEYRLPLQSFTVEQNLEISSSLTLKSDDSFAILGAAGFVDLSGEIVLNSNALIFAGGDLHLHTLKNGANTPVEVLLISGTGRIIVDNSQEVRVNAISPLEVSLPLGVNSETLTFQPPRATIYIMGESENKP